MTSLTHNFNAICSAQTAFQTLREKTIHYTYRGIQYHYAADRPTPNNQSTKPYTLCYRGVKIEVNPAAKPMPVALEPQVFVLTYRATQYLVAR